LAKVLTRKELYDLVWSKPMSTLAQEYGLSDRGLAKLCERSNIPGPPRGYWAKKEAGQKVKQPPFHPTPKGKLDKISINGNPLPPAVKTVLCEEKQRRQEAPKTEANSAEARPELPKVIQPTINALRAAKPDKEGVIHATGEKHCGISVTASCADRVISILEVLSRRLEERGVTLQPLGKGIAAFIEKDNVELSLIEIIEKRPHIPTAAEAIKAEQIKKKKEKHYGYPTWTLVRDEQAYPEFDFIREGKLSIQVTQQYTNAHSLRRNWRDGKKTLENQMDEIVAGMLAYLAAVKEKRLRNEEWDRKWKREGRIRELSQEYNERENKRLRFIQRLMERTEEATSFQKFIDQMEIAPPTDEKIIRMLTWTKAYVAKLKKGLEYPQIAGHLEKEELFPAQDMIVEEFKQLQAEEPSFKKEDDEEDDDAAQEFHGSSSSPSGWFPGKQWYQR